MAAKDRQEEISPLTRVMSTELRSQHSDPTCYAFALSKVVGYWERLRFGQRHVSLQTIPERTALLWEKGMKTQEEIGSELEKIAAEDCIKEIKMIKGIKNIICLISSYKETFFIINKIKIDITVNVIDKIIILKKLPIFNFFSIRGNKIKPINTNTGSLKNSQIK